MKKSKKNIAQDNCSILSDEKGDKAVSSFIYLSCII